MATMQPQGVSWIPTHESRPRQVFPVETDGDFNAVMRYTELRALRGNVVSKAFRSKTSVGKRDAPHVDDIARYSLCHGIGCPRGSRGNRRRSLNGQVRFGVVYGLGGLRSDRPNRLVNPCSVRQIQASRASHPKGQTVLVADSRPHGPRPWLDKSRRIASRRYRNHGIS